MSIGLSAALAEYKKHRATVARLKRFCSTLAMASITLVLGSCAESQPPNLIASRHLDAVAASAPHLQIRPGGRRRDGLLGETSNTHNSGRVVEVMTKWLSIESEGLTPTTELAINYVVFSFLSDSAVNTSSIALGAAQTEVWRYGINRTWCRVLTLPFSTSTVMPLDEVSNSGAPVPRGALAVTFLTGSADGTLGKVRFWDAAPLSSECSNTQITVPTGEGTTLYNVMLDSIGPGSLDRMKLVPVSEGFIADSAKRFASYRYLYAWGRVPGCGGSGSWVDSAGNCFPQVLRPLTVSLLKDNQFTQTQPVLASGDPATASLLSDFDATITANSTGGVDFRYGLGFADSQTLMRLGRGQISVAAGPQSLGLPEMVWDDNLTTGNIPYNNVVGMTLVPPTALGDQLFVTNYTINGVDRPSVGGWLCTSTSVGAATRGCINAFSTPTGGQIVPGYSRVQPFAPYDLLKKWAFDPDHWIPQTQGRLAGTPAANYVRFLDWNVLQTPLTQPSGTAEVIAPAQFFTEYTPFRGNPSAKGVYIDQFAAFVAPGPSANQLLVYRVGQVNDFSSKSEDGTQQQMVHGGVVMCSSLIFVDPKLPPLPGSSSTSGQGNPNVAACNRLRTESTADGVAYATAQNIFPNQTFMSSPLFIRFSVSPSGTALLTYVSLSGAIAQINASDPGTDWTGLQAWTTISPGRSAGCHAKLFKPTPPSAPAYTFWSDIFKSSVLWLVAYGVSAIAEPVGIMVDVALTLGSETATLQDQATADFAWRNVYQGVRLDTECGVGP